MFVRTHASVCACLSLLLSSYKTCSTSPPSGDQVDGLPLFVNARDSSVGLRWRLACTLVIIDA